MWFSAFLALKRAPFRSQGPYSPLNMEICTRSIKRMLHHHSERGDHPWESVMLNSTWRTIPKTYNIFGIFSRLNKSSHMQHFAVRPVHNRRITTTMSSPPRTLSLHSIINNSAKCSAGGDVSVMLHLHHHFCERAACCCSPRLALSAPAQWGKIERSGFFLHKTISSLRCGVCCCRGGYCKSSGAFIAQGNRRLEWKTVMWMLKNNLAEEMWVKLIEIWARFVVIFINWRQLMTVNKSLFFSRSAKNIASVRTDKNQQNL